MPLPLMRGMYHMTNFADRTIWTGDNLDILCGLNPASVDLIYCEPLVNSNRDYPVPESIAVSTTTPDLY